jgi:hypothetical protein
MIYIVMVSNAARDSRGLCVDHWLMERDDRGQARNLLNVSASQPWYGEMDLFSAGSGGLVDRCRPYADPQNGPRSSFGVTQAAPGRTGAAPDVAGAFPLPVGIATGSAIFLTPGRRKHHGDIVAGDRRRHRRRDIICLGLD